MVKKLRCTVASEDYVKVDDQGCGDVRLHVKVDGNNHDIFLTPSDAKKLRKQIKKALIEIEGEPGEDIEEEKEEPVYIPHVGEVAEVYRNTTDHAFQIGQKVRVVEVLGALVKAESLNTGKFWWVGGDIRPIQNWEPKAGEKVLVVGSTFMPRPGSESFVGGFGYVRGNGNAVIVCNEDKSDWFGFNLSDLRPAE